MTEQEKQTLIEWAHKRIEPARRTVENNPQDESAKASLALYEIALASLNAPPVKLPAPIGVFMFTSYVKKALEEAEIKYEVEE